MRRHWQPDMPALVPPARRRQGSGLSRSFLRGPGGPCGGSTWTSPALRRSYKARESAGQSKIRITKVSTVSGEPRSAGLPGLLAGSVVGMQGERAGEPAGPDVWEMCRELIPAGSGFAFLGVPRGGVFPAEMFADMYPSPNGRPSLPPQVLAAVVVLQALHGLSDFETVQQL